MKNLSLRDVGRERALRDRIARNPALRAVEERARAARRERLRRAFRRGRPIRVR